MQFSPRPKCGSVSTKMLQRGLCLVNITRPELRRFRSITDGAGFARRYWLSPNSANAWPLQGRIDIVAF